MSTYSNLKFELIANGDQSGTWGGTTNVNIGTAIDEAITGSATVTFSGSDVTLTWLDTNATQTARNLRLFLTGSSGGNRNLIVPSIEKQYIIYNDLADKVTVKNSTGTGVVIPPGSSGVLFNDGTNVVAVNSCLPISSSLTLKLPTADGTVGQAMKTDGNGNLSFGPVDSLPSQTGNSGKVLTTNGSTASWTDNLIGKTLQSYSEVVNTIGIISTSTYNIDLSLANIFDLTLGTNVTVTFTNPVGAGFSRPITLVVRQPGSSPGKTLTVTGAKYTDGTLPVLSTGINQIDVLTYWSIDGGTTYFGTYAMANVS